MSAIAGKIIEAMLAKVKLHGLSLMDHYPDDLTRWDYNSLSRSALPGARFGWCVGHLHTHLSILGVHAKLNEHPTYHTNLSNDDRFYVIEVGVGDSFTMKEVTRKAFPDLAHTPIPYRRIGGPAAFWLYRNDVRIGTGRIEVKGVRDDRRTYHATLQVMAGTNERDKVALEDWAQQAGTELAGTLFRDLGFTWEDPIQLALAA